VQPTERSRIEQAFSQYLGQERGLARATVVNYLPEVRRFLSWRFATGPIRLDAIRLPEVTRFVVRHAHAFSPRRV
jgi:site-specific recombinase XerD